MRFFIFQLLCFMAASARADLSHQKLRSLIQDNGIKRLEDVLPLLPAEYLENFDLISESHSLQSSDAANPRVISFGLNSRFVLAFNGDPSQTNFNKIEAYEFHPETNSFEFRTITFSEDNMPQFSDANPARCLSCHGTNPRPILGTSGNDWGDAFGSFEDRIESPAEKQQISDFWRNQPTHSRYKFLKRVAGSSMAPFTTKRDANVAERPGLRFSSMVNYYNGLRIGQAALQNSFFTTRPYGTLMVMLGCRQGPEYYQYVKTIMHDEFSRLYPKDKFPALHSQLQPLYGNAEEMYLYEILLTGPETRWTPTLKGYEKDWPWWDGVENTDTYVLKTLLLSLSESDSNIRAHFRAVSLREHAANGFQKFLAGGVAERMSTFEYLDTSEANKLCPYIFEKAFKE